MSRTQWISPGVHNHVFSFPALSPSCVFIWELCPHILWRQLAGHQVCPGVHEMYEEWKGKPVAESNTRKEVKMPLKTTQVKTAFLLAGIGTGLYTRWKTIIDCWTICLSRHIHRVGQMHAHAHTLADNNAVFWTQHGLMHTCWPPSLASQCRKDGLETL